jgi:hypothetical protein
MNTPIETQTEILAELWMNYRDEEYFKDFFVYADLGFPLSYLLTQNVVTRNPETDKFIGDTWEMFLGLVALEDTGFETLGDVLVETDIPLVEDD